MGAAKLPTANTGRNAAWLQLAALAVTLTAWLRHLALDGEPQDRRAEGPAVPAPGRPGPPGPARPRTHPEDPRRLGLGRRPDQRLDPTPRPPPQLTRLPQRTHHHRKDTKGRSGTGSHPGTRAGPARPQPEPGVPRSPSGPINPPGTPVNHRGQRRGGRAGWSCCAEHGVP